MEMNDLDAFDLKILDRLQINNRVSLGEIGKAVNLSTASVHRRLRRMEDAKIIQAHVAVVDPRAVGRPITLIVEVLLDSEQANILDTARDEFAIRAGGAAMLLCHRCRRFYTYRYSGKHGGICRTQPPAISRKSQRQAFQHTCRDEPRQMSASPFRSSATSECLNED